MRKFLSKFLIKILTKRRTGRTIDNNRSQEDFLIFKIFFPLLPVFFFFLTPLTAKVDLEPALQPKELSTSLIIPCSAAHFKHIPNLLRLYDQQTVPPNEIVISLAPSEKIPPNDIVAVESFPWNFHLKIIKNLGRIAAGQNRNIAVENCTGDLILAQDADDLPHPQRVEIVKYLFENFQIDHLLHSYTVSGNNQESDLEKKYQLQDLEAFYYLGKYPPEDGSIVVHNACVCFLRHACEKIRWPEHFLRTEDTEFNVMVYEQPNIKNKVVLTANLIHYRWELGGM